MALHERGYEEGEDTALEIMKISAQLLKDKNNSIGEVRLKG